jgi:thiol-disulfide isomerase/thioredoxin
MLNAMFARSVLVLAMGLLLTVAFGSPGLSNETVQPLFVKVHADWCGTCTRLEPTWSELQEEFGGEATFVVLDVTDRAALERAQAEADRLGIGAFFAVHKARTGTIGILDGRTGEPLAVMKGETNVARYREAWTRAQSGDAS